AVMLAFERDDTDWFELAKHTRQRKFGDWDLGFDLKQKAKQQRYLYSRGFSSDQVNYAFELNE
ncbi:RecX family transcriptional regulator, partial [Oleiphilus sp. HI0125]